MAKLRLTAPIEGSFPSAALIGAIREAEEGIATEYTEYTEGRPALISVFSVFSVVQKIFATAYPAPESRPRPNARHDPQTPHRARAPARSPGVRT